MSWWDHLEGEVPSLAELGVTQVWLPPVARAMRKEGYLVIRTFCPLP